MHAIWTGEHHCMDFTIAPNPFITIVDLANKLKSIRLGTGTVIAPFWHPIKLRRVADRHNNIWQIGDGYSKGCL